MYEYVDGCLGGRVGKNGRKDSGLRGLIILGYCQTDIQEEDGWSFSVLSIPPPLYSSILLVGIVIGGGDKARHHL